MTGCCTDGSRRRQRDGGQTIPTVLFFLIKKKNQTGDLVSRALSKHRSSLPETAGSSFESHNGAPAEEEDRKVQTERRQVGGQGAQKTSIRLLASKQAKTGAPIK